MLALPPQQCCHACSSPIPLSRALVRRAAGAGGAARCRRAGRLPVTRAAAARGLCEAGEHVNPTDLERYLLAFKALEGPGEGLRVYRRPHRGCGPGVETVEGRHFGTDSGRSRWRGHPASNLGRCRQCGTAAATRVPVLAMTRDPRPNGCSVGADLMHEPEDASGARYLRKCQPRTSGTGSDRDRPTGPACRPASPECGGRRHRRVHRGLDRTRRIRPT